MTTFVQDAKTRKVSKTQRGPRRAYHAPGREEQKQQTRDRILQSALDHFAEWGYEAASIRDISAGAGVAHAIIRVHYGTKENLWRAAIDELFSRQETELGNGDRDEFKRLTPESFQLLVHRYVRYCARHPEHVRIMTHETLRDNERVQWMVEKHIARVQAPLMRSLKRAMAEGWLRKMPLPSLMYALTSASQMIFALGSEAKHLYNIDVTDPAVITRHAEAVCSMFLLKEPK